MLSPPPNPILCPTCGARIETTASGDFGCMACWLRSGLEGNVETPSTEVPESLGTYRIERNHEGAPFILGRGAMGVTYRAQDVSLERKVALKIIHPDFFRYGADARERFVREARAAASLHHPHVATIYQFGIDEETGQCFCAMELIEGETLDQRVERSGPFDVSTVLKIARQVVDALLAAEKQGIVHRDLKPANIMIAAREEPEGVAVKIIDFGLAKALRATTDPRALTQGSFLGTPAFASPEQRQRAPVDARSDIYSLGATIWFLLTAQLPFENAAPDRPPLKQLKAAHASSRLVSLLLSMLAIEPAARPTAKQVAARLDSMPRRHARGLILAAAGAVIAALTIAYLSYRGQPAPEREHEIGPPVKSVAVLPFANLGDEKGNASFADGVQDELLTDLAHIADLKVVSRTSVMQYKGGQPRNLREIGRQLGVAYVVEGTVRTLGNKVRVSAQLIDARSDLHRWAQIYDRPLDDLFAIQSEIAKKIAEQLDAKIAPHEKAALAEPSTHNREAFALFTRARALFDTTSSSPRGKENLLQAAQLLAEATAQDPNFLLAWCELAKAHDSLYFLGLDRTPVRLSLAEEAVNTARKLDPDAGEAHLARARHLYQCYLAYEPALAELEIARRKLPNDPAVFTLAGYIYRRQGKIGESATEFENALSLDPRNVYTLQQVAISKSSLRQYADAAIVLDRALTIAPGNIELRLARDEIDLNWHADTRPLHDLIAATLAKHPAAAPDLAGGWLFVSFCERNMAEVDRAVAALGDNSFGPNAIQFRRVFWEGLAAKVKGDTAEAIRAFSSARAEEDRKVTAAPDFAPGLCMLAVMDAGLGHKTEAIREGRRAVEMLPVSRDPVNGALMIEFLAVTYAWSGESALACDQLEIAARMPSNLSYGQLKLSPLWDSLRGNPRFERIVASLAPEADR